MPKYGYSHYRNPGEAGEFVFVTTTCLDFVHAFADHALADLMAASLLWDCHGYSAKLFAFVVMPHHVHAVIRLPEGIDCRDFMRRVKANSARRLIPRLGAALRSELKHQRSLNQRVFWMRSFRSLHLRTNKVFRAKLRYVHQNPVRAGLAEKPGDYRWSSARLRVDGRLGEDWDLKIDQSMIEEFAPLEKLKITQ